MFNPLHLSHRELRGLAILLILLPLAPGALLGWSMYQKEKARYQDQTTAAIDTHVRETHSALLEFSENPSQPTPRDLASHLAAEIEIPFIATSPDGSHLSGTSLQAEERKRVVDVPVPEGLPLGSLQILVEPPPYSFSTPTHEVAVLIVVIVGLLAGWAVTRQLRINEIENDSLSTVAHELKTPIASTRVLLESLSSGAVSGEKDTKEYVDILLKENSRLQDLAENFLTHSKLEGGGMAMDKAPLALEGLLESVVTRFLPRTSERGGNISFDIEVPSKDDGKSTILGDRAALQRLLGCLVDNALKYSPDAPEIQISARNRGDWVDIDIADRGIGIPIEEQRRVFEKFYQVDQRLRRQQGGCGLGLAIAKRLVKEHKGEISIARNPGGGTIVQLSLPRARNRPKPSNQATS